MAMPPQQLIGTWEFGVISNHGSHAGQNELI